MKRIYDFLKSKKINVYFPGQHKGLCTEPYVVIHKRNQMATNSNRLGVQGTDIILYVPHFSYIRAEDYEEKVRVIMRKLEFLRKTGFETPWILDNDKKAFTKSMEYLIQKELEG